MKNRIRFNSVSSKKPEIDRKQIEKVNVELQTKLIEKIMSRNIQLQMIQELLEKNQFIQSKHLQKIDEIIQKDENAVFFQEQQRFSTKQQSDVQSSSGSEFQQKEPNKMMASTSGSETWSKYNIRSINEIFNQHKKYLESQLNIIEEIKIQVNTSLMQNLIFQEQQNQRKLEIIKFEEKILEMNYILFNKEVIISNDHIGKKEQEKPFLYKMNLLNEQVAQKRNICKLFRGLKKINKQKHQTQEVKKNCKGFDDLTSFNSQVIISDLLINKVAYLYQEEVKNSQKIQKQLEQLNHQFYCLNQQNKKLIESFKNI